MGQVYNPQVVESAGAVNQECAKMFECQPEIIPNGHLHVDFGITCHC